MNKKSKIIFAIGAIIIIGFLVPSFVQWFYGIGETTGFMFSNIFHSSEILNYFGAVLSFAGTIILGALALWQNNRLHERNVEIEEENKRIQKLLAQEYVPFLELENVELQNVVELIPESFNENGTTGVNSSTSNAGTTYTITIYNAKHNWTHRFKKDAKFDLKNTSKAKISAIEFVSVTLESVEINQNGNLAKRKNDIKELKHIKKLLVLPEEQINCTLQIFFDDEGYYEVVQDNSAFEFTLLLKITTIMGITYEESIEYSNYFGVEGEIEYNLIEGIKS